LALRDGPQGLIAFCHAGCSRDALFAELHRLGLFDGSGCSVEPVESERQRAVEDRRRVKRIAEAMDFWRHETTDPAQTAVARYWAVRGLGDLGM